MKLRAFHSEDGDCLLLFTEDNQFHMLVDGGRPRSFQAFVRDELADLRDAERKLNVVCVSHIDEDHIAGIVNLIEDEVAWRIAEFHQSDPEFSDPEFRRPPEIDQVWHNALFELLGEDMAPTAINVLATNASILAGSLDCELLKVAAEADNLATGERSSFELSRRISAEQLGIPVNQPADGGLMLRGAGGEAFSLGGLDFFILGPSEDDLPALRNRWQKYITDNEDALEKLRNELKIDEENLPDPSLVANPLLATRLGENESQVSPPNLASLMFLVEDEDHTVLLTGDGVSSEILQGLEHHGKLDADGNLHVDVLKVQHHGEARNVSENFVRQVTADNYVFCGNGASDNPESDVVKAFANARLSGISGSGPVGPNTEFKFWLTSRADSPDLTPLRKEHMEMLQDIVEGPANEGGLIANSGGRMTAEFLEEGHFDIL